MRATWPPRPLGRAEPLLTAAEVYPALERAVVAARESIWFWFRIFDPTMALVTDEGRAFGKSWNDLLTARSRDGLDVALTISDFDPLARPELHAGTWRSARGFEEAKAAGLKLMIADHGARAGLPWRLAMAPLAVMRTELLRRRLNADPTLSFDDLPGVHASLRRRDDGRVVWRAPALPALKPRTHHQKLAVFDRGSKAILGGVDVDWRRWDSPRHEQPAPQTWRDLSVGVDGPVAGDAARFLVALWNFEAERLGRDAPRLEPPDPVPDANVAENGAPSIRLSVTRSVGVQVGGLQPSRSARGLERDHMEVIRQARRLLYVETQFLRSRPIARALAAQAARAPELELILVLPAAPDDVAFENARGLDARFGEHLQARCVEKLHRAFGDRLAVVSPAQPATRDADDRSALRRAGVIYVHTKAIVADDAAAIVSSANLNGRSLRWDTESGVVIRCPRAAAALRRRLSESLLPESAPDEAFALKGAAPVWRRLAETAAGRPPPEREGFLLPYDLRPAREFGRPAPMAPEELV